MTALRSLRKDGRGVTAVEFALVLPVLLLLMMGLSELAFEEYVQAVLNGAVQKAARDSTIQGNATDAQATSIDDTVKAMLRRVVPSATFPPSQRVNFDNYAAIAGEPFTDSKYPNNSSGTYDGICDHNETYVDVNGNGKYDLDLSSSGQGGASDVTKYTFTVIYNRLFPARIVGLGQTVTLSATTLLKNQPYQTQGMNTGTATGTCK